MPLPSIVAKPQWRAVAYAGAVLVLLPLLVLALSWNTLDSTIWNHLLQTQMTRLLGNTLVLVLGVVSGVVLLGVSLAWLTSLCSFPGDVGWIGR